MGQRVVITKQALADLRSSTHFIARDDSEAAVRFGDALIDGAVSLSNLPDRGRVVPEFRDASIRELLLESYRIVYRRAAHSESIEIL